MGLVEGVAEATAAVVKYISGRVSDRMPRKKPLVLLGYGVANLVRPLLSIAVAPWQVLAVRFVDRIGKGIRTAPRDVLIARATPERHRAYAFGFHRGMDNLGAVFGPIAAMAVLAATHDDLRMVFAATIVPGMLSLRRWCSSCGRLRRWRPRRRRRPPRRRRRRRCRWGSSASWCWWRSSPWATRATASWCCGRTSSGWRRGGCRCLGALAAARWR
ncbi:MAG: MFS transporter [Deltaproteobacteria bacterium]|nr:MFS transporter [Deltaproteobacteria bacterium]